MSGSNALQITDPNADNPLAQAPSWADAYGSVTGSTQNPISDLQTWLAAQRAKSSQMGLWDDQTGLPSGKGLVSAAGQYGNALLMGTTAPGRAAPIAVSGGPLRGQSNIVRFREDADAIHSTLPPEPEGHTRLWRGNRPDEVGVAQQFTNDLPGIALPFRESYGGPVSYVDVPSADVGRYLQTDFAAPDAEFWLPPNIAGQAKAVHVAPRAEPGARKTQ